MTEQISQMRREITQIPDAVDNLLSRGNPDAPRHLKKVTETV